MKHIEVLADIWCNGTKEDRQGMSYIPCTFNEEEKKYFHELLVENNSSWFIHYFENEFE